VQGAKLKCRHSNRTATHTDGTWPNTSSEAAAQAASETGVLDAVVKDAVHAALEATSPATSDRATTTRGKQDVLVERFQPISVRALAEVRR